MTHIKPFLIPPMGEALDDARIVNWNVKPGQSFSKGDVLLEIETDKSVVEIAAEENGKLVDQLIAKGDTINADTPVANIEVEGEAQTAAAPAPQAQVAPAAEQKTAEVASISRPADALSEVRSSEETQRQGARQFATPVARSFAREKGIDIAVVSGTGPGNRVTKLDVVAALGTGMAPNLSEVRKVGMEELNVTTRHGELFACRWASTSAAPGPTIVLIHGLFGDTDTWASTIASATRNGLGVLALDLPCHGRSKASATNFSDIVEAVAEAIVKLCDRQVVLVGHSLGAAVASRVARDSRIDVAAVTLFAPVGLGTEINQSFLDGMIYARSEDALEREIGKLTAAHSKPSVSYLRKLRQRLDSRTESLVALCRDVSWNGVQQINVLPDLEALTCPVSIVHGRSDAIIPWEHALNVTPRVALHLIPQVGHMAPSEAMVLSSEIIERFALLDSNGSSSKPAERASHR